jgi:diaminohydroxyphosphoribosylaminopyrimidine deaminase / 5-amino-6-(5-phosphoribosylamino)uracil reductase
MAGRADAAWMERALALAEGGRYTAMPNPVVGCVLVHGGACVGEGFHRRAGEAHAEVNALAQAGERAHGATAYVTLEPCVHHGRTPPCADALIAAGVARVVAACEDPNPLVAGRGLGRLREAGIAVEVGLSREQAEALNPGFAKRMRTGRPYVRVKMALSLDGRAALSDGRSQWITGAAARADVHAWRARSCAIVTGVGTVLADDPQLTARVAGLERTPLRVVVDAALRCPPRARVLHGPGGALLACVQGARDGPPGAEVLALPADPQAPGAGPGGRVDLRALLDMLGARACNEVWVEAGPTLAGAFLAAGLADELVLYLAPRLLGDGARPAFVLPAPAALATPELELLELTRVGDDIRVRARPRA